MSRSRTPGLIVICVSQVETTPKDNKLRKYFILISGAILGICLYYALLFSFQSQRIGLTFSHDFIVLDSERCHTGDADCGDPATSIQIGDKLLAAGDYVFHGPGDDAILQVFSDNAEGGIVPVTVLRGEEVFIIDHRLSEPTLIEGIGATAVALIISMPYWFIGTGVLLYMVPHDDKWLLFVLFSYLAAIWLSVGINSSSGLAYANQLTHALTWLMVPTIIHLHLTAPSRLLRKTLPAWIIFFYSLSIALAVAEIPQRVPENIYLLAFILAIFVSGLILIYRAFLRPPSADRLASRFMLTGLTLAPGMAIFLWLPLFIGNVPDQTATNLALLAMPAMPLFYGYALYKHQLGRQEARFNRLLALYSAFLVYLSLLIITLNYTRPRIGISSELLLFASVILIALLLALLPLRNIIFSVITRLTYGKKYNIQAIVNNYARLINETSGPKEIIDLLLKELLPTLNVEESAMLLLEQQQSKFLYQNGLNLAELALDSELLDKLHKASDIYLMPIDEGGFPLSRDFPWLRLIISLKVRGNLIGFWLFGQRQPDDYYNSEDIQMLTTLASHLAMKLYNDNLYAIVQQELTERKLAEANLARISERLQLINDIDQAILSARSAREIAQVTLMKLMHLIPCDRATVVLFDIPNQQQELLAAYDKRRHPPDDTPQQKMPLVQEPRHLLDGITWIVEDTARLGSDYSALADALASEGLSSTMSTPLLVSGKLLGALNLSASKPGTMTSRYQEVAEEIASSIAIAIHNAKLRETIDQHRIDLEQLSSELINAQENERKRLSYELHDEMGQLLTAITFNLAAIEKELEAETPPQIEMKLLDTRMIVEQLMRQVRDLSLQLRPAMLQDLGLVPTLRWYVNTFTSRTDIEIKLETINVEGHYSESTEIGLYRIIQEALTNVSKHSNASSVQLCLERSNSQIHLQIEDNGQGFDVEKVLASNPGIKGVGLVAIRERIKTLNGELQIRSEPGQGTQLLIDIPLEKTP